MKARATLALLVLGSVAALAQAAPQQKIDPAKEADIRRLLEVTGAKKLTEQSMSIIMEQIKPALQRQLPPTERAQAIMDAFLRKFQAKFNYQAISEEIIPVYDKYLSAEDIKGLIRFYESPLGQRAVQALPQIAQESQMAGYQLGQKIAREVLVELREEYPELKQPGPGNR